MEQFFASCRHFSIRSFLDPFSSIILHYRKFHQKIWIEFPQIFIFFALLCRILLLTWKQNFIYTPNETFSSKKKRRNRFKCNVHTSNTIFIMYMYTIHTLLFRIIFIMLYEKVTKSSIYLLVNLHGKNLCEKVLVSAHGFLYLCVCFNFIPKTKKVSKSCERLYKTC